jgi:cytochrome c oxidase cbb3-type subunit 3
MFHNLRSVFVALSTVATVAGVGAAAWRAQAQDASPQADTGAPPQFVNPTHSMGKSAAEQNSLEQLTGSSSDLLLKSPVSNLHPGGIKLSPNMPNPVANDPDAANWGMRYFIAMNCVGCHAPNGGGGMGPALSNRVFIYGSSPSQIYLSIVQGRPRGMPSWGTALPDSVVWDLVAYIESISRAPKTEWGTTVSATSPKIEQVPAEYQTSTRPWDHTEPFSYGQNPEGRKQ